MARETVISDLSFSSFNHVHVFFKPFRCAITSIFNRNALVRDDATQFFREAYSSGSAKVQVSASDGASGTGGHGFKAVRMSSTQQRSARYDH